MMKFRFSQTAIPEKTKKMPTNRDAYLKIRNTLMHNGFPEAEAEAREIICHYAHCDYSRMITSFSDQACFDVDDVLNKRLSHVPVAYILNLKYFYSLPFYVDENVLIPRYDSEIIVYEAVNIIKQNGFLSVLDMCCGSGCLGIAVSRNTGAEVLLADISEKAVAVAEKNIKKLLCCNVSAVQSDLFSGINGKFDVIICNPPYVTEEEYKTLDPQVRCYEPKNALVGGLDFYKRISSMAADYLNPGGYLLYEIGCSQADDVTSILEKNGFGNIRCEKDLNNLDRVIICTKN